jgi:hypothetical protein
MNRTRRRRADMYLAMRRVTARLVIGHRKRAIIVALVSGAPDVFLHDLQLVVNGREVLVPRNRLTRARARQIFAGPISYTGEWPAVASAACESADTLELGAGPTVAELGD